MKWIFAAVVVVAMATKMAEACCAPDQTKADFFFLMNVTMTGPHPMVIEVTGMGNFAIDFPNDRLAFEMGPIVMKFGQQQRPLLMKMSSVFDMNAGSMVSNIVLPTGQSMCISQKVTGKMTDKHQCMPDNAGLTKVMETPEMTMYQAFENGTQFNLALDGKCVPKLLQVAGPLDDGAGAMVMQLAVDKVAYKTDDSDYAAPCTNAMDIPGVMKVPVPKDAIKKMSSSSLANVAMKRR